MQAMSSLAAVVARREAQVAEPLRTDIAVPTAGPTAVRHHEVVYDRQNKCSSVKKTKGVETKTIGTRKTQ